MYVQVGVWGSKELAKCVMERQYPKNWLKDVSEADKDTINNLHPIAISKDFQSQFGSIMPKLLRYYDLPGEFLINAPNKHDLTSYKKRMDQHLAPYLDINIGLDSRFLDKDEIQPYPYLNIESKDYFTIHNFYSIYACDTFLKLINQQLQNLCPTHCYMTQIRAYDTGVDQCYQSISIKNPDLLKDFFSDKKEDIQQAWLGRHEHGYAVYELLDNAGELDESISEDLERLISPLEMNELIKSGLIDKSHANIELHHKIKWREAFNPEHLSLMSDIFHATKGYWNWSFEHSDEIQMIDFDWDKLD